MNHLLAHFPNILANEQRDLTKKRRGEQKKNYSRCHARLYEKADPLKALGSVASFLRNSKFYLINDIKSSTFAALSSLKAQIWTTAPYPGIM
jgi:hypothetical protein